MNIGERIRARRKELGLSLRELGLLTEVSASFLSQVENNQVSPSLNSLQMIAKALQVPMFYFMSESQGSEIVRKDERPQLTFSNSKIGYDLLTPNFGRKMMALLIRMQPHARRIALPLARPTEQWMYVMQGKMEITVGDVSHTLECGDAISFDGDLLREFKSVSDEELQILCCITPPAL